MERKIYYHDTDSGGVVYYANYLKYLEEARTEYLESIGYGVQVFIDQGLLFAVRSCQLTYKSPARYGDTIVCDARVDRTTGTQIFFKQNVWHKESGRVMVEAEVGLVCLTKEFKPAPLPSTLREKLS